jgi:DnaJ-class molecular chaperone
MKPATPAEDAILTEGREGGMKSLYPIKYTCATCKGTGRIVNDVGFWGLDGLSCYGCSGRGFWFQFDKTLVGEPPWEDPDWVRSGEH